MNYFGYPGDIAFTPQNRVRPAYKGTARLDIGLGGLGSVQPLLSGAYRGATGQRVPARNSNMQNNVRDRAVFAAMGVPTTGRAILSSMGPRMSLAGLGLTDKERCVAMASSGSGVASAIMQAIAASQPGGTEAQRQARDRLQAQFTAAGAGLTAAQNLCNLIDATPPVNGEDPLNLVREQLARLEAQQAAQGQLYSQNSGGGLNFSSMNDTTKIVLGVGALALVGGAAYLILKKK